MTENRIGRWVGGDHWPAVLSFAGWVALTVLTVPQGYLGGSVLGGIAGLESALRQASAATLPWAVAAFLILMVSRRGSRVHPPARNGWTSQCLLGLVLVTGLWWLARAGHWPVLGMSKPLPGAGPGRTPIAAWLKGLALYLGVWGICQAGVLWRRQTRMQQQLVAAELRRLRTQLNPHFLFNTLNAIAELGYRDPEAADHTITQLSGLLRKSLDDSHQREISLRDELDFLQSYLSIQQTLLRGRLNTELGIARDTLNARVPGMILQPLVENALTHGIGRAGSVDLMVRTLRAGDMLVIEVQDNGWGLGVAGTHPDREGIGISNTRARLRYLYGGRASLQLHNCPGMGVTVRLKIPYHETCAYDENPHPDR